MCTFYNIDVSDMTIRQINRLFRHTTPARYGLFVGGSTLPKEQSGVCSGPLNTPTQTALNMPLPLILK